MEKEEPTSTESLECPIQSSFGAHTLDLLRYAYNNLTHRKLRSYLTVLGIVIGIASIVVLISIAQGLDESIRAQLARFGSNYIVVVPGQVSTSSFTPGSFKGALYQKDADAIRLVEGIADVSAAVGIMMPDVEFKGKHITPASVRGVEQGYGRYISTRTNYSAGKFFNEGDTGAVVIGYSVAHDSFDKEVRVGETLSINGRKFKVVGIIEKTGDAAFDGAILIDIKAARELKGEGFDKNRVSVIFALAEEGLDIKQVAERVEQKLLDMHHVSKENKDFTVITATSVLDQISIITNLLTLFMGGMAAVSLIVGGIGIMNTMVTAVIERTREIGTLRAIGACSNSVLQLFLLESSLIGFAGGILGVLFGLAASFILNFFGAPSKITPELLLFCIFFAVVVGGISGYLPARRAASLEPIEALRYE